MEAGNQEAEPRGDFLRLRGGGAQIEAAVAVAVAAVGNQALLEEEHQGVTGLGGEDFHPRTIGNTIGQRRPRHNLQPRSAGFDFERMGGSFCSGSHRAGKGIGLDFRAELFRDRGLCLIRNHSFRYQVRGVRKTLHRAIPNP
jgi:hypothetical protein